MELTPRLACIARQVPAGCRFVDVGTDHAYLPVSLLLDGVLERAIAADLRSGPLERARQTALQYGVQDRISFRLCDGLSGVSTEEADVIAIAGMGGDTIAAILAEAPWTRQPGKLLLLQPMTATFSLRSWLWNHAYQIEREVIAREGKRLYSIWTVSGGESPPWSLGELWAGRQSEDSLRGAYLAQRIAKAEKALQGHLAAVQREEKTIEMLQGILEELYPMKEERMT